MTTRTAQLTHGEALMAVVRAAKHWSHETGSVGGPSIAALQATRALHEAVITLARVEAQTAPEPAGAPTDA